MTAAHLPFVGQFLSQVGSAPVSATLQVVYLGLFPTTLGFTTWAYALARTTSARMGATIYAVPTLVIIMSWLILGQVPRWLAVAGGASASLRSPYRGCAWLVAGGADREGGWVELEPTTGGL